METDFETKDNDAPWYKVNPKDGSELVLVPGGWFWMGSGYEDPDATADEEPRHLHYVEPFYFGIACITVAQFRRFMKESMHGGTGPDWQKAPGDHPVRYVSWHAATAYCEWAGLRLPTETEWELAARGYRALRYPWGKDWEDGRRVCWDRQKGPIWNTVPVYAYPDGVGTFGSFQQSGNLWEWCADTYEYKVYQRYARRDFSAPSNGQFRVLRGGSWGGVRPEGFRGAHRYHDSPDYKNCKDNLGFRVAGTVTV
jgi:formylglycine-generating enzyme